eukprot:jgi/Bigna1/63645/fgenesh1_kg.57_\
MAASVLFGENYAAHIRNMELFMMTQLRSEVFYAAAIGGHHVPRGQLDKAYGHMRGMTRPFFRIDVRWNEFSPGVIGVMRQ